MNTTHNLGFPRIGKNRELKNALERYWRGEIEQQALFDVGSELRRRHWALQKESGIDLIPVGDFAWYDHVLTTTAMLGALPDRHVNTRSLKTNCELDIDCLFRAARGRAPNGTPAPACDMTKWFNTNYHYIVPELKADQSFALSWFQLFDEVEEAKQLGIRAKPVLLGPVTFLWLGKCHDSDFDKLSLLDNLLPVYTEILDRLAQQGVEWVQIDEPVLALELPAPWLHVLEKSYHRLQRRDLKLLVATWFGGLGSNLHHAVRLPVDGIHLDAVNAPDELGKLADQLPGNKILSAGIVNGRNVWRNNLHASIDALAPLKARLGERLWIAPSCSLLHCPVDLDDEKELDAELRSWLAFGKQKLAEVTTIARALSSDSSPGTLNALSASDLAITSRAQSDRVHNPLVQQRLGGIQETDFQRHLPHQERIQLQQQTLQLPLLPTTTIGSFPQTSNIRSTRRARRQGDISESSYQEAIREEIKIAIEKQESLGVDVLVHGEAERNDMVEYFGELLDGFAFTVNGWVQSYGSRCVKPPIIYGDVSRPKAMTVAWSSYAQSLSKKPVKGMLTGPVTMLSWSFPREDISRQQCAFQIALALRDEVTDLEKAGIGILQIDEPALREGLPLRQDDWQAYLEWAVNAFRLTVANVNDSTQIHTHMCYSEFNDIIKAIAAMDADVITIETARSKMALLEAFENFSWPNQIGPGIYDIHSPNVPGVDTIAELLRQAIEQIPSARLWVNPDCGLKTRTWAEVESALTQMVAATRVVRAEQEGVD